VSVGVVAAALILGADRGAQAYAEHVAAGRIQDCVHSPTRPSVSISGFPFLLHAVRGRFDHVSITAHDARVRGIGVQDLHADLRGIRRSGDGAHVASLDGSAAMAYSQLNGGLPTVQVAYGGPGAVRVSGGIGWLSGSVTARPRIDGKTIVLAPQQFSSPLTGGLDFTGALPAIRLPLPGLPDAVTLDLHPTERGLQFAFRAADVIAQRISCD
jgi:hypothetical protein